MLDAGAHPERTRTHLTSNASPHPAHCSSRCNGAQVDGAVHLMSRAARHAAKWKVETKTGRRFELEYGGGIAFPGGSPRSNRPPRTCERRLIKHQMRKASCVARLSRSGRSPSVRCGATGGAYSML